jgi:hypothetical protein
MYHWKIELTEQRIELNGDRTCSGNIWDNIEAFVWTDWEFPEKHDAGHLIPSSVLIEYHKTVTADVSTDTSVLATDHRSIRKRFYGGLVR